VRYGERRGVVPRQQLVAGELPRRAASRHNKRRRCGHRQRTGKARQQNAEQAKEPHPISSSILIRPSSAELEGVRLSLSLASLIIEHHRQSSARRSRNTASSTMLAAASAYDAFHLLTWLSGRRDSDDDLGCARPSRMTADGACSSFAAHPGEGRFT